jgi:predicted NBD/HSP70 family sugar kinase
MVEELLAEGFVREVGRNVSAAGRPGVLLELNPDSGWIIGSDIGVGHLSVVLANLRARVSWRRQVPFSLDDDVEAVLDRLTLLMVEAKETAEASQLRLLGAGVAVPGLVDVAGGRLRFEPNMGWRDVPLRDQLAERLGMPVFVDNDANAAALAERYFGAAQGVEDFVYVVANIGLGTGLVIGGQIHYGLSGFAGEAGHTTIDPLGPPCRCGNRGCWERLASLRSLVERVSTPGSPRAAASDPLIDDGAHPVDLTTLLDAARGGDALVLEALRETGVYLGIGIANLVNLFNPALVAFGGSLSQAHDYLLPVAREVVRQRAMAELRETRIVVSAFLQDACVMGGVALVLHDILSRPRLVPAGRMSAVSSRDEPVKETVLSIAG